MKRIKFEVSDHSTTGAMKVMELTEDTVDIDGMPEAIIVAEKLLNRKSYIQALRLQNKILKQVDDKR